RSRRGYPCATLSGASSDSTRPTLISSSRGVSCCRARDRRWRTCSTPCRLASPSPRDTGSTSSSLTTDPEDPLTGHRRRTA
ncbi:unnamed protein product, partial [Ectocarpus sp. 12 AP-2014]